MSGYDIKKLLTRATKLFGTESNSQIYPILKRLEAAGCVVSSDDSAGGRSRKLYSITKDGKRKMLEWLNTSSEPELLRDELVLKMSMGMHISAEQWQEHLNYYQAQLDALEESIQSVMQHIKTDHKGRRDQKYLEMAYSYPLLLAKARRDWAEDCIRQLKK